jgi:hypothetical protein
MGPAATRREGVHRRRGSCGLLSPTSIFEMGPPAGADKSHGGRVGKGRDQTIHNKESSYSKKEAQGETQKTLVAKLQRNLRPHGVPSCQLSPQHGGRHQRSDSVRTPNKSCRSADRLDSIATAVQVRVPSSHVPELLSHVEAAAQESAGLLRTRKTRFQLAVVSFAAQNHPTSASGESQRPPVRCI